MAKYKWNENARTSGRGITLNSKPDAAIVGMVLEGLGERYSESDVVDAARKDDSPIHPCFEWDDSLAGEKYRQEQAKLIVRCVHVVREDKPEPETVRAFVSTPRDDEGKNYTSIQAAMVNSDDRLYVLQTALNSLVSWRKRWRQLNELADAAIALEKVDAGIRVLQKSVSSSAKD